MSMAWPPRTTRSVVIRPHRAATAAEKEVGRILRRLKDLTLGLNADDPQFDRRAGIAATALLMAGEELDMAGVRPR